MKKYFAVVAVILSLTAHVALAQEGIFEDMGLDLNGRIVIVTDARGTAVTKCERDLIEYKAVIIKRFGGPAIVTKVAINFDFEVAPGDRFDISSSVGCFDKLTAQLHIATQVTRK